MSTDPYLDILNRIQQLSLDEQVQLLEDLRAIVQRNENEQKLHNIMEFKGMAGDAWENVEVEKYINNERNSWE